VVDQLWTEPVDGVDGRVPRPGSPPYRLWTTNERTARRGQTSAMSIELPAAEVYALADQLRALTANAEEVTSRLGAPADVGGSLQPVVEAFLDSHVAAGRAITGELRWLGDTVAGIADSWLTLDRSLLARVRRPGAG
jgi:hypothetical protein